MRIIIFLVLLIININLVQAESLTLTADRMAFLQAKAALVYGSNFNLVLLSSQLHQYVLYPYVQYAALTQQLTLADAVQVDDFLKSYADTPLAERLQNQWLSLLASQQAWEAFLKYYQASTNSTLQCYYAQALWHTQQKSLALKLLPKIWLNTNALTEACLPLFTAWIADGNLTPALAWQRVQINIKANQTIDNSLLDVLPPLLAAKARLWQVVKQNPELIVTQPDLLLADDDYTKDILLDGIQRLAIQKPQQTATLWPQLQDTYDFSPAEKQIAIRAIAIELARSADPTAATWLALIQPAYVNDLVKSWRIRTRLAKQDWPAVINYIQQLPIAQRSQPIWQYWLARALAKRGKAARAQIIYQQLSMQLNYYGLLASRQLQQVYYPAKANSYSSNNLMAVTAIPAIQRAHELYQLKMIADARREWQWALKKMSPNELHSAAQLAMQWNWVDRALITAAKAGDYTNLPARFPVAYRQQIILAAQQLGLDPAWVLAIIRQESGFMPDAKSGVGALGLMQLMPRTAHLLNANLTDYGILDTDTNIILGSHYLKQLYDLYNHNIIVATAAYNIGPTRLQKWLPLYQKLPTDIWIDILPWQETREYVQAVALATIIYQQQLYPASILKNNSFL